MICLVRLLVRGQRRMFPMRTLNCFSWLSSLSSSSPPSWNLWSSWFTNTRWSSVKYCPRDIINPLFSSTPGRTSSLIPRWWNSHLTALTEVWYSFLFSFYLIIEINLISILDQTDEKLETAEFDKTETELDPPTESPGKMINLKISLFFLIKERDVFMTDSVVERRFARLDYFYHLNK